MRIYPTAWLMAAALSLPGAAAAQSPTVAVYVTAKDTGQRLARTNPLSWMDMAQPSERQQCVFIDPSKTFQTVVGIGGALTDAAAETFYKLPEAQRRQFLRACFDPQNGIGYTLGRTHINSCDFSSASYTYVAEGDRELKSFDIAHDLKYRIPFIKEVLAVTGKDMSLFISPWSPPAWMKDNNDMLHGGKLKPDCYDAWARYYIKFIQAYEKEGIPIWGLTVQNEPMAVQTWESCVYTGAEERDFVKNNLGPALSQAGLAGKKLMIWDHNRSMIYQRAQTVLEDSGGGEVCVGGGVSLVCGGPFTRMSARCGRPGRKSICCSPKAVKAPTTPPNWMTGNGGALRHGHDQRFQQWQRRLDGLERVAGRAGRAEPCRQFLFRADSR